MGKGSRSKGVTAAELAAQLESDPQYRRQAREREARRSAEAAQWREAERPIVEELGRVNVDVRSIWDLVNTDSPYPAAIPVLVKHLEQGGYPDRVMEALGRSLAVKPAVNFWSRLRSIYLSSETPGQRDGVAVALAACATVDHVEDLVELLSHSDRGESRIYFLRPIVRLGGGRGRSVLQGLLGDETFGAEAEALLA